MLHDPLSDPPPAGLNDLRQIFVSFTPELEPRGWDPLTLETTRTPGSPSECVLLEGTCFRTGNRLF